MEIRKILVCTDIRYHVGNLGKTILLVVLVGVVALMLWWSVSNNTHTGPAYYDITLSLWPRPPVIVTDTSFVDTVQTSLDVLPQVMGPAWQLSVQDTLPDTPYRIIIRPLSGMEQTDSGDTCANPEWRGSADYSVGVIYVCTDWWRSQTDIQHTILHEMLHMMGLGHYHGPGPNIMCSTEEGWRTCTTMVSGYGLEQDTHTQDVLRYLYGDDGWGLPNLDEPCVRYYPETASCAPVP